ncbi:DUF6499 domain-containing protein [Sphingopyxis sp.]|uniref:transcriptional regulator domain-containing protein n=1 Tax=Sphingopyxis sp. TaxID=1908224 RepID=UPI00345B4BE2
MTGGPAADWRSTDAYRELLVSDRRTFAGEWLRRNDMYRRLWSHRNRPGAAGPERFALLGWIDPALPGHDARPIWSIDKDPRVLRARLAAAAAPADDLFDVRSVAPFVSVEIDAKTSTGCSSMAIGQFASNFKAARCSVVPPSWSSGSQVCRRPG